MNEQIPSVPFFFSHLLFPTTLKALSDVKSTQIANCTKRGFVQDGIPFSYVELKYVGTLPILPTCLLASFAVIVVGVPFSYPIQRCVLSIRMISSFSPAR